MTSLNNVLIARMGHVASDDQCSCTIDFDDNTLIRGRLIRCPLGPFQRSGAVVSNINFQRFKARPFRSNNGQGGGKLLSCFSSRKRVQRNAWKRNKGYTIFTTGLCSTNTLATNAVCHRRCNNQAK